MTPCACGCGVSVNPDARGRVRRFVHGHNARLARPQRRVAYPAPIEQDCGYQTPCLIWRGPQTNGGYGRDGHGPAHTAAWERVHGPVPTGRELDHLCRVRLCVRLDHLEPVTRLVNIERGRLAKLTRDAAVAIRAAVAGGERQRDVAERFGVSPARISLIVNGKAWRT